MNALAAFRPPLRLLPCLVAMLAIGAGRMRADELSLAWRSLPPVPDPEGLASPFGGVAGGRLLVGGGSNFPHGRPWEGGKKVWSDAIYALDPVSRQWTKAGVLPQPMAYGVSVSTADGTIWAGGADAQRHYRAVTRLRWTPAGLAREPLADLPEPTGFGSGVLAGHYLYLAGGIAGPDARVAQSLFWRLDLRAVHGAWEKLPSWPGEPRMLAEMGSVGDTVFVLGGVALHAGADGKPVRTYLRDCYAFAETAGWRRVADLPATVAAAPSPVPSRDGKLFVIAGDDGTRVALAGPHHPGFGSSVWVFDSAGGAWSRGPDTMVSRATAPTAPWEGGWVIVNGERMPGVRSPEVWALTLQP